jgi:hypothetical protein
MTCEPIECPICYDQIEGSINTVTTECGHKFHAKCLMQNVAHNGFGCPCCRAQMVERSPAGDSEDEDENENEDSEYDSDDDDETNDNDSENTPVGINREQFSNYALLGLRLFTNRLEDVEHDPEDVMADYTLTFQSQEEQPVIPTIEYITERLIEQGVTMNQLVHTLAMDHREYENWDEAEMNYANLSERIRRIINEFPEKTAALSNEAPIQPPVADQAVEPSSHLVRS